MPPDAIVRESGRMQDFAAAILRHEGALVEAIDPEGLEVLAPAPVQRALDLGEMSRLGFGVTLPAGAQRVGMEGDWLDRFARLLGPQGRWSRRVLRNANKAPGDPDAVLAHALALGNATFRLLDVRPAWTRYLMLDFRVSAVSDDKRDFIVRLGLNLATGAMPDAVVEALRAEIAPLPHDVDDGPGAADLASSVPEDAVLPDPWPRDQVLELAARGLRPRLDEAMAPFVKGLQRRLARDQDRLYGYHNDLHREAGLRARTFPEDDARRRREEQRAEAIGREYQAKLDDLARQYATRVTAEWVQTLEIVMPVQRFCVQIRRRKADRTLLLDWNAVARRVEPPLCDFSASPERPSLVCDDALHLVVPAGLAPCASCDRPYCRACHRVRCPRCAASEEAAMQDGGVETISGS